MTTRERLRAILRSERHHNLTQLAKRLGVSRQRIGQLLAEEGYTKRHRLVRAS